MEALIQGLLRRPLSLRVYPDKLLSRKAAPLEAFNETLRRFIQDMIVFMKENNGVGLAAPQVGVLQRIIVAEADAKIMCLVNPRIVFRSGMESSSEGCLSLPGRQYRMDRNTEIGVRARSPLGKKISLKANGLLARILQHEIDHLDGILICDRGAPVPEETE
jgi:peptide deformylase